MITEPSKQDILRWINALRSGKFKQGQRALESTPGHFCCMGVACKIFIPDNKLYRYRSGSGKITLLGGYANSQGHAPKWLAHINNSFSVKYGNSLSYINDTIGLTFDEIADLLQAVYIEEVL